MRWVTLALQPSAAAYERSSTLTAASALPCVLQCYCPCPGLTVRVRCESDVH